MTQPWDTGYGPQQPYQQQPPYPQQPYHQQQGFEQPPFQGPAFGPGPQPAARAGRSAGAVIGVLALVAITSATAGFFVGRSTADTEPSASAADASAAAGPGRLQAAYDACTGRDEGDTLSVADGGHTIVIETRSEYGDPSGMNCVLDELGTPESITAEMGRTTAMMGVQDAKSDGISYSWSYHPDNGVDMVITDEGPAS